MKMNNGYRLQTIISRKRNTIDGSSICRCICIKYAHDSLINKTWQELNFETSSGLYVTDRLHNDFPAKFAFNQAHVRVRTESIWKNAIVLCMNLVAWNVSKFFLPIDPFYFIWRSRNRAKRGGEVGSRFVKLSKIDIFFSPLFFSFSLFSFLFFSFWCQRKIDRSPLHSENWFTYIVYVGFFLSYGFYFSRVIFESSTEYWITSDQC